MTYEYDSVGRRFKRTLQNSIPQRGTAGQRTWVKRANGKGDVYKYDAIDQLTNVLYEATNPDTTPSAWTNEARYVFDAAGNRSSVTYTNTGTENYSVNGLNQYTEAGSETFGYDGNGNLNSINGDAQSLEYDSENRLRGAFGYLNDVWYYHDGLGRLGGRETGWAITRFVYDSEWRVIAEYDESWGDTTLKAKYVYGPEIDEPLRMQRDGTNYYYHAAALGTVTEITGSTGTLLEQYRYDVYGEPTFLSSTGTQLSTSAIGNRFLFQGRDRDPDTGLYNFRHRYYSPSLGRFVQTDPAKIQIMLSSVSLETRKSLYCFVLNNPLGLSDPFGLGFGDIFIGPLNSRICNRSSDQCLIAWSNTGGYQILKAGECTSSLWDYGDFSYWNGHWYKCSNPNTCYIDDRNVDDYKKDPKYVPPVPSGNWKPPGPPADMCKAYCECQRNSTKESQLADTTRCDQSCEETCEAGGL